MFIKNTKYNYIINHKKIKKDVRIVTYTRTLDDVVYQKQITTYDVAKRYRV